jgi:hypothetical protein
MQITRYQQPLTTSAPPSPLARPIRRRSFQNEVLIEKYDRYLLVIKVSQHTRRATRAKTTGSCFLRGRKQEGTKEQCGVGNDWEVCWSTTRGERHKG